MKKRKVQKPDYKVIDMGYISPCWIWQKYVETKGRSKGYPKISTSEGTKRAHKWCYENHFKVTLLPWIHLDHLCRNRACVNPHHLEPVTHRENIDRKSIFSWEQAEEVRALQGVISQQKIAEKFGISRRYVRNILSGESWSLNGATG